MKPPAFLIDLCGPDCSLTPIGEGMSNALVYRVRGSSERYIKLCYGEDTNELRQEIARTAWLLSQGIRVPDALQVVDDGKTVAWVCTAVSGVSPDQHGCPIGEIIEMIARAVAALHALPAQACPFDESVEARLARARDDIAHHRIDPDCFDERNAGRSTQDVYDRLEAPPLEDTVIVHGDATFANIRIDHDGNVGFIDCGRAGRGDRYVDLARVASEIAEHFGAEWITPFAQAYGIRWDAGKARFFDDLYELF